MITEDYVSFETARLLKEKGFKIPYNSFRGVYINGIFKRLNPGDGYGYNTGDEIVEVCSLQMAMKWLREAHGLFIFISPWTMLDENNIQYYFEIREIKTCDFETLYDYTSKELNSFEKVAEVAIRYCLENLI